MRIDHLRRGEDPDQEREAERAERLRDAYAGGELDSVYARREHREAKLRHKLGRPLRRVERLALHWGAYDLEVGLEQGDLTQAEYDEVKRIQEGSDG